MGTCVDARTFRMRLEWVALLVFAAPLAQSVCVADDQAASPVVISVGNAVMDARGGASIEVILTSSADQNIAAIQFDIGLAGVDASAGAAAIGAGKTIWLANRSSGGRVLIAGPNRNHMSSGTVATLKIANAAIPPAITISNAFAVDPAGLFVRIRTESTGIPVPIVVVNAASYGNGAIAPGEIVLVGGQSLGMTGTHTMQFDSSGTVATELAGTRVWFDGFAAPLLYTTPDQVAAIVPYAIDGRAQAAVEVEFEGVRSASLTLPVAQTAPGVFTVDASGRGQAAVINQDGTINGPLHPAPAGSIVSIYATGEGQTTPAGVDGKIVDGSSLRRPLVPVTVSIGGQPAEVIYAGSAGGQVSGLLQVNARVPAVAAGAAPLLVTIGAGSQSGVTITVQ
jgi:uncharacterized protein (TIGR03437 family)